MTDEPTPQPTPDERRKKLVDEQRAAIEREIELLTKQQHHREVTLVQQQQELQTIAARIEELKSTLVEWTVKD
jgi:hypothetical protein